jgi:hypothetical protein
MKRTITTLLYLQHSHAFPSFSWRDNTVITVRHDVNHKSPYPHRGNRNSRRNNRLDGFIESDSEINTDLLDREIDLQLLQLEEDLSDILLDDTNNNADAEDTTTENAKKLIECDASVVLPFGADVAFDAFSDLTRQP